MGEMVFDLCRIEQNRIKLNNMVCDMIHMPERDKERQIARSFLLFSSHAIHCFFDWLMLVKMGII